MILFLQFSFLYKNLFCMKQVKIFAEIIFLSLFFSCEQEKLPECGFKELGLETTEVIANVQDSSFTIKVKEPYWSLYKTEEIVDGKSTFKTNTFYWKTNNENIFQAYHDTMYGDWFKVLKNGSNSLVVNLKPNTTSSDKKLLLYIIGSENDSDILTITQKGKSK